MSCGACPRVLCGRSDEATIQIKSDMISRKHAWLEQSESGAWTVKDLKSLNGIYANDQRIPPDEGMVLCDGDRVRFGIAPGPGKEPEYVWTFHRNVRVKRPSSNTEALIVLPVIDSVKSSDCTVGMITDILPERVSSASPRTATHLVSGKELQVVLTKNQKPKVTVTSTAVAVKSGLSTTGSKIDCGSNMEHERQLREREERLASMEIALAEEERKNKALEAELGQKEQLLKMKLEKQDEERSDTLDNGLAVDAMQNSTGTAAASQLRRQIGEIMETELQCSICSELFIKAVSLNCSHSFCSYCINQWIRIKDECPICRTRITSRVPSIVLDNYINRMIEEHFSGEMKARRESIIAERLAAVEPVDPIQRQPQRHQPQTVLQSQRQQQQTVLRAENQRRPQRRQQHIVSRRNPKNASASPTSNIDSGRKPIRRPTQPSLDEIEISTGIKAGSETITAAGQRIRTKTTCHYQL